LYLAPILGKCKINQQIEEHGVVTIFMKERWFFIQEWEAHEKEKT
jgi:hypothetical protein